MKFATKTLIVGLVMAGGIAFAESKATDPDVHARQNLMQSNGAQAGVLGGMAGGKTAFDQQRQRPGSPCQARGLDQLG
jgi:cytochrome c556